MAPEGLDVRPTTDRVREATFNALVSLGAVADARVLDLFAGSGALGVEALSRGAGSVTFVEPDRGARAAIDANLVATGLAELAKVVSTTAESYLSRSTRPRGSGPVDDAAEFDLVLCDPPYQYDAWPELFASIEQVVAPDAVVVVESDRRIEVPDGWQVARDKRYGGTVVCVVTPPPVLRDRSGERP